jgi:hypothetical protein
MAKSRAPMMIATFFVCSFLAATLGCGGSGGSSRQLQSIAVTGTGMVQLQFTAAGAFNASPVTVNPLLVSWYVVNPTPYTLTSQPFQSACQDAVLIAVAPIDPMAPATGTIPGQVFQDLVTAHTTTLEGGFVASSPQFLACP